jgi:PhzF family phenazine biosynthesis protein
MPLRLLHVDAFTNRPFSGNPAAVCFLEREADAGWMQSLGAEMNLPETAFVRPIDGPPGSYELRWFTPTVEVDLCGHATIASAHALWQEGLVSASEPIFFHTRSGILTATRSSERIELDFPALEIWPEPPAVGLLEALRLYDSAGQLVPPTFTGKSRFDSIVLEIDSPELLRRTEPEFYALGEVATFGVILTSRSDDPRYDYLARFFAPAAGIPEDPATGSAHCILAPYWQQRLGKDSFTAYQASKRGGVIHTQVKGNRVLLAGQAVTILRGELSV